MNRIRNLVKTIIIIITVLLVLTILWFIFKKRPLSILGIPGSTQPNLALNYIGITSEPDDEALNQPYLTQDQISQSAQIDQKNFTLCPFYDNPLAINDDEPITDPILYTFSKPRVIFTAKIALESLQWLPTGDELLLTYSNQENGGGESIAIFDVSLGKLSVVGKRQFTYALPIWLDEQQVIAYSEPNQERSFRIIANRVDSSAYPTLYNASRPYISPGPNGSFFAFSQTSETRIDLVYENGTTKQFIDFASFFTEHEWDYEPLLPQPSQLSWNPLLKILIINTPSGLFFINMTSGDVCEVDLGIQGQEKVWAYYARWSPDNRYLALLTTTGTRILQSLNLMVLDTQRGQLLMLDAVDLDTPAPYFSDITWSSDSHTIASLVGQGDNQGNHLVVVDIGTGYVTEVFPDITFYQGGVAGNIDWSIDGRYIAAICTGGSICLIEVTR